MPNRFNFGRAADSKEDKLRRNTTKKYRLTLFIHKPSVPLAGRHDLGPPTPPSSDIALGAAAAPEGPVVITTQVVAMVLETFVTGIFL